VFGLARAHSTVAGCRYRIDSVEDSVDNTNILILEYMIVYHNARLRQLAVLDLVRFWSAHR
jgi:hypothetical protein